MCALLAKLSVFTSAANHLTVLRALATVEESEVVPAGPNPEANSFLIISIC